MVTRAGVEVGNEGIAKVIGVLLRHNSGASRAEQGRVGVVDVDGEDGGIGADPLLH